jgi:hypothetical protein
MRSLLACALILGASLPVAAPAASAADFPHASNRPAGVVVTAQSRRYYRPERDCTPTAGPYGFYGNIWCQPANEASYLRNLGSNWPMATPPSLRAPKPRSYSTDW